MSACLPSPSTMSSYKDVAVDSDPNSSAPNDIAAAVEAADIADEPQRDDPNSCKPTIKYVLLREAGNGRMEEVELEQGSVPELPPGHEDAKMHPEMGMDRGARIQGKRRGDEDIDETPMLKGSKLFINEGKCNSKQLEKLIMQNIVSNDALASKRAIHEASLAMKPAAGVDVICSETGFTYLVSTVEHCEAQKNNVICFVYKRPL
ncbi:unnamed protein product, partial [Mesorhabditis spiculigera]